MKQYIISLLLVLAIMWYSGIFSESLIVHYNREYYSPSETRDLYKRGIINKPDLANRRYYSKHVVKFISKRGYIPFVYKRDTVYDGGLHYYSESLDHN